MSEDTSYFAGSAILGDCVFCMADLANEKNCPEFSLAPFKEGAHRLTCSKCHHSKIVGAMKYCIHPESIPLGNSADVDRAADEKIERL